MHYQTFNESEIADDLARGLARADDLASALRDVIAPTIRELHMDSKRGEEILCAAEVLAAVLSGDPSPPFPNTLITRIMDDDFVLAAANLRRACLKKVRIVRDDITGLAGLHTNKERIISANWLTYVDELIQTLEEY